MQERHCAAMAMGAMAGIASAQSTVTVYGIVDGALSYTTNVDASGHDVV